MAMEAELNEKLEQELIMMYSIIMNDGVKTKIPFESSDIIDKLQTNITLMLEKFKMMGSRITELEEENEKLKEENEKLQEQDELKSIGKDDDNGNYQDIIEDLENANKELQDELKELLMKEYKNEELEEEIEQKEEEIKDLREKCAFDNDSEDVFFAMYEVLDKWKLLEDGTPKFMEMWDIVVKTLLKFKEENKKLKEENKANRIDVDNLSKLREAVRKELGCEPDPTQETIIKAIKELKEKNEKLKAEKQ